MSFYLRDTNTILYTSEEVCMSGVELNQNVSIRGEVLCFYWLKKCQIL